MLNLTPDEAKAVPCPICGVSSGEWCQVTSLTDYLSASKNPSDDTLFNRTHHVRLRDALDAKRQREGSET